jgi:hypothetical protein
MFADIFRVVISNPIFWIIFLIGAGYPIYTKITRPTTYTWKEFLTQIICGFLVFLIIYAAFFLKTNNLENQSIINTKVKTAEYFEPWTEKVTRRVCHGDKNQTCETRTSYEYHPASYTVIGDNGHKIGITSSDYNQYSGVFGHTKFLISRYSKSSFGDGNGYRVLPTTPISMSYIENYVDYIKGSQGTILKDQSNAESTTYNALIKDYPTIINSGFGKIDATRIYDPSNVIADKSKLEAALDNLNIVYGGQREANIILAVVPKISQDYRYALMQAWNAPRKNDIIILVSLDNEKIQWVNVIAFTKHELFKKELEQKIYEFGKIDESIVPIIQSQLTIPKENESGFLKEKMENYSYLQSSMDIPWYWNLALLSLFISLHFGIARFFAKK